MALEVHRAEQGAYPSELKALVPDVLDRLPEDPDAPDGRFRYRRTGKDGYLLYGVGVDREDNGGTEDPEYPTVALSHPIHGRGYDYIIRSTDGSAQDAE